MSISDDDFDLEAYLETYESEFEKIGQEEAWTLIEAYYEQNNPASHHIESYNDFVLHGVRRVLERTSELLWKDTFGIKILHETVRCEYPEESFGTADMNETRLLYPREARLRRMTYDAQFFADIRVRRYWTNEATGAIETEVSVHPSVAIGRLPVMVRSILCNLEAPYQESALAEPGRAKRQLHERAEECEYDPGGYFVVNGVERVLIPRERLLPNVPRVFRKPGSGNADTTDDGSTREYKLSFISHDPENVRTYAPRMVEIFVVSCQTYRKQQKIDKRFYFTSDALLQCSMANVLNEPVLFPILVRALGLEEDLLIAAMVCEDPDLVNFAEEDTSFRSPKTRRICKLLLYDSLVLCGKAGIYTQADALDYLAMQTNFRRELPASRIEKMQAHLDNQLLPHLGCEPQTRFKKAAYLCYLAHILCATALNYREVDDRDSYVGKQLEHSGAMMERLLARSIYQVHDNLRAEFDRALHRTEKTSAGRTAASRLNGSSCANGTGAGRRTATNSVSDGTIGLGWTVLREFNFQEFFIRRPTITNSFRYALGTGNWVTGQSSLYDVKGAQPSGYTQALNEINYFGRLAILNKIRSTTREDSKIVAARQLHSTAFGVVCPCETPEGGQIGIVKSLGLLAHVTKERSKPAVVEQVQRFLAILDDQETSGFWSTITTGQDLITHIRDVRVFVNGDWIGTTLHAPALLRELRELRRMSSTSSRSGFPHDASVYFDVFERVLHVRCDGGRLARPLFIVDPGNRLRAQPKNIHQLKCAIVARQTKFIAEAARTGVRCATRSRQETVGPTSGAATARHALRASIAVRQAQELIVDMNAHPETARQTRVVKWKDLFTQGLVELVDVAEVQFCLVGMTLEEIEEQRKLYESVRPSISRGACGSRADRLDKIRRVITGEDELPSSGGTSQVQHHAFTHCEIHPATILGVAASLIPFPDHNQSPRNTYQSAMGKQAQGAQTTKPKSRQDTIGYELYYPQRPLVATNTANILHYDEMTCGQMSVVAIMPRGYNQEDSVIMNQSSIDRGFMRSTARRSYTIICKGFDKKKGTHEQFERPDPDFVCGARKAGYDKLDDFGMPEVGAVFTKGEIFLGKVLYHPEKTGAQGGNIRNGAIFSYTKSDMSVRYTSAIPSFVDQVLRTTNERNEQVCTVVFRSCRIPTVGDKVSSRHGQKGTIGMTYRQEDMPFTASGVVPDIIMNPHAIPSRMTIGQLVECVGSKVAAVDPSATRDGISEILATPFTDLTVGEIFRGLKALGYNKQGLERMTCGMTGLPIKALVFIGPTFYQRLRHMADDKLQARSRFGPRNGLTRQPVEGKAREGGLRFGEMERDCMLAYGGCAMLQDRLMNNSDRYSMPVCGKCGIVGAISSITETGSFSDYACRRCRSKSEMGIVTMPYAMKLMAQELAAMNVNLHFTTS